jgi:hypothetical protein
VRTLGKSIAIGIIIIGLILSVFIYITDLGFIIASALLEGVKNSDSKDILDLNGSMMDSR